MDFVPARYFDTVSLFAAGGAWAPDAVLVHTAPPDRGGYLSLGVSVSYPLPAARRAPLVIAQVNPRMPRTLGNAFLHRSQIDCWVEIDHPLVEYPPTPVGEVERRIAGHVAELIPDGATIQVGVGSIPQAIMEALGDKQDLGVHSLLVEHMLPLVEAGVITNRRKRLHPGRMDIGEIMGTARLFAWSHENPAINMEPSDLVHDPHVIGELGDFVSVNSALEVDLLGQVNAESVDGRQVTGIGGQFDFALGRRERPVGARSSRCRPPRRAAPARASCGGSGPGRGSRRRGFSRTMSSPSMEWHGSEGRATPGGRGSWLASPTRRGGTRWKQRLRLELVDLREDLLVLREAIGHLVVVDHLPVYVTVKMPPAPSLRSAVMPYLFLMAACKLEAWGR